jgi:hypothetical protein
MLSHRSVSAVVALGYLALVAFGSRPKTFGEASIVILIACAALLLPMACIWFPEVGEYTGNLFMPGVKKPTPPGIIRAGGWFLLLVEFVVLLFLLTYS